MTEEEWENRLIREGGTHRKRDGDIITIEPPEEGFWFTFEKLKSGGRGERYDVRDGKHAPVWVHKRNAAWDLVSKIHEEPLISQRTEI